MSVVETTQRFGSTYGVSGRKWEYAAKASVATMLSSFGGGCVGLIYSLTVSKGQVLAMDLINSVLGSLVAITAGCFLYSAPESVLIGAVGGFLACVTTPLLDKIGIDDPVGASTVHGIGGIWGLLAVGFFANDPKHLETTHGRNGLFHGGELYLLGIQATTCVVLFTWSFSTSILILWLINKVIPIRLTFLEEILGADLVEHQINHPAIFIEQAIKILAPFHPEILEVPRTQKIGSNPGHVAALNEYVYKRNKELQNISGIKLYRRNEVQEEKANVVPYFAWMD